MEGKIARLAQDSDAQEKMLQEQADMLKKVAQEELNSVEITHLQEKELIKK